MLRSYQRAYGSFVARKVGERAADWIADIISLGGGYMSVETKLAEQYRGAFPEETEYDACEE